MRSHFYARLIIINTPLKKGLICSSLKIPLYAVILLIRFAGSKARATARGGRKMLSDNRGVTSRVRRMLFRKVKNRTLFDYLSRSLEETLGIKVYGITDSPISSIMKRFVWLYNVYAVNAAKDHPEKFDAVLATQLPFDGVNSTRDGFVLISFAQRANNPEDYCANWQTFEVITLKLSSREEEQMWLNLRQQVDSALKRAAVYAELLARSSQEISGGHAGLVERRSITE